MLYSFIHSNLVLFRESLSVISTKMDIISFLLLKVRGVAIVFDKPQILKIQSDICSNINKLNYMHMNSILIKPIYFLQIAIFSATRGARRVSQRKIRVSIQEGYLMQLNFAGVSYKASVQINPGFT